MKKYNLLYIGCLTAALSITSCDVDLLNIPQEGVISEENFYKTDDDCNEAITAVYNSFRNTYSGDINEFARMEQANAKVRGGQF